MPDGHEEKKLGLYILVYFILELVGAMPPCQPNMNETCQVGCEYGLKYSKKFKYFFEIFIFKTF